MNMKHRSTLTRILPAEVRRREKGEANDGDERLTTGANASKRLL
jgi:hypothetical protein